MKVYLIDGNSYIYRAFHAIKGLSTSRGMPTNAVFGFVKMLLKIIQQKRPDAVVVAFDSPAPTKRHRIYSEYKAQRPETPHPLLIQIPYIRRIVDALRIKTYEVQGYEADDVLAALAMAAARKGLQVYIVTADKDMLQMVNKNIKIYDPVKDRVIDRDYVVKNLGVPPERIPEMMALTGDSIDNIPGVKGIGEKTARMLLSEHKLQELIEDPSLVQNERLRKALIQQRQNILMSLELARLDPALEIDFSCEEARLKEPDWQELLRLFRELEFWSLMKMVPTKEIHREVILWRGDEMVFEHCSGTVGLRYYPGKGLPEGVALLCQGTLYYLPFGHITPGDDIKTHIRRILSDRNNILFGHNLKESLRPLLTEAPVEAVMQDVMIASWLLNPNRADHGLQELALEHMTIRIPTVSDLKGRDSEGLKALVGTEMTVIEDLREELFRMLRKEGMIELYEHIEMPLIEVLAHMERRGIKVDIKALQDLSARLSDLITEIQERIYTLAGKRFNLNSPKQLSEVLFKDLGLKPKKRTKTGFSTEMAVLQTLAEEHEVPREILRWRSLSKLKSTYVDALQRMVDPLSQRVHTTFNQTATSTGRLSSSEPNLQNIPVKGDWGDAMRRVFIAEDGYVLLSADYSQIELRILAHLSGDEGLIRAFLEDRDIHRETALQIFSVQENELNEDMRRIAKTVNFGIAYGISAFGLSEATGTSIEEAQMFIDRYFETFPGVKRYAEGIVQEAKRLGYVKTLFGRKRQIPELFSSSQTERALGERIAINTPVQGTAADIIKMAMISIHRRLMRENLRAKLLLQVHDELLLEVPEDEIEEVEKMVKEEMESTVRLRVPLKVETGIGTNWAEAHP